MSKLENELEALVDTHGLYGVVLTLEQICYSKSEHLASNWQDKYSAANWQRAGVKFDELHAALIKIQDISMSR